MKQILLALTILIPLIGSADTDSMTEEEIQQELYCKDVFNMTKGIQIVRQETGFTYEQFKDDIILKARFGNPLGSATTKDQIKVKDSFYYAVIFYGKSVWDLSLSLTPDQVGREMEESCLENIKIERSEEKPIEFNL